MRMSDRPEFFEVLGLAPPVTVDDVKQAYLEKVKLAHPDHGGNVEDFRRLQEAFEQAVNYANFRADRMKWLGVQAERYAAQEAVIKQFEALGGRVEMTSISWMKRSFGEDFAQLMDRVVGVTLRGPTITDATLELLVREQPVLQTLQSIDLVDTRISDFGALMLRVFQELRRVDLSRTPVTSEALHLADWLPELRWLGVRGTRVSIVGKLKAKFSHPLLVFG
jgi:hypothetical protein